MSKYNHVISLGYFCSPALELERIGLRDASYPFDWIICDFKGVLDCIENKFDDFLKYENIYQYKDYKQYYIDQKYNFHFYHDFSAYGAIKNQLPSVLQKYQRRIERFRLNIKEPTLFLRYIESQKELDYIEANYENIISVLKAENENNDLILISNDDVQSELLFVYKVKKDKNDSVARRFLDKNAELKNYLCSDIYDTDKRLANIENYKSKKNKEMVFKYTNYAISKINKLIKKPYIHSSIIDN